MFKKILQPLFKTVKRAQTDNADYYNELSVDVLARTIWGEARGQGQTGMEAVANVVMNRVATAKKFGGYWWGNDVISVCQKPYQFSCWNRSDPNYKKLIAVTDANLHFATSLRIARRALTGVLNDHTFGADHYHADYVSPYWAQGNAPTITIGNHIFYRLIEA